jgi:hypothetical protein
MWSGTNVCPIVTKSGVSRQIITQVPDIKVHGNPSSSIRADTCGQTDQLADMTNRVGAFRAVRSRLKTDMLAWIELESRYSGPSTTCSDRNKEYANCVSSTLWQHTQEDNTSLRDSTYAQQHTTHSALWSSKPARFTNDFRLQVFMALKIRTVVFWVTHCVVWHVQ